MTRFTAAIVLSTMGLIALGLGAPATYDQRQDGGLNFSGKLENILIVIASGSGEPSKPIVGEDELAAYLSMLGGSGRRPAAGAATQLYDSADDEDSDDASPKPETDGQEKDVIPTEPGSSPDGKVLQQPAAEASTTDDKIKLPKARSLWGQVKEVVDNKEGRTLKKELSWGQNQANDEGGRSSDHNEVGLQQDGHFTLLGDGIEDCGPERRRNSYGICQSHSEE